jgi:hypothetical protein
VSPFSSSARPMARTGQHVQYSVCTVQCENVLPSGQRLKRIGYFTFTGKEREMKYAKERAGIGKEGKGKERKGRERKNGE